jgi:hypothetical protein
MADDDKDKPQPSWWKPTAWFSWFSVIWRNQPADFPSPPRSSPPVPPQQQVWVPDQVWDVPPRPRNIALESQSNFVPPPMEPPPGGPEGGRGDEIEASFKEVERCQVELTSAMHRLRTALTGREAGPGHNQGPPLQDLDEVDDLIALFKYEGPRIKTAFDAKPLIEQTEKIKLLPERIWSWLKAAGWGVAGIGLHKVTENLTAPLWDDVAHKISDLCRAIEVWVSLLPPM